MSLDNRPVYTGGCQCGAVRFRIEGALKDASVCHCRMCQKASGGFYMPLATAAEDTLSWTRGERAVFRSSSHVVRGFCAACGTPLTYEGPDGIGITIGSFDTPEAVAPTMQWGVEGKLPYVEAISDLPARDTLEDLEAGNFLHELESYQHPDHDTDRWPAETRS